MQSKEFHVLISHKGLLQGLTYLRTDLTPLNGAIDEKSESHKKISHVQSTSNFFKIFEF